MNMNMNPPVMKCQVGGLNPLLLEAATALAKLTESRGFEEADNTAAVAEAQEEAEVSVVSDEEGRKKTASRSANSNSAREIFPQRLMAILSDKSLLDVVTWLPHGRSFVIIRPDVFTENVLPKYLPPVDARASAKYPSFTRKLNRWGFRQATRGPDTGAFHHPLFRRDQPALCQEMICQRSRDRKSNCPNSSICSSSHLPLKKRVLACDDGSSSKKISPLTKESLEAMSPPASQTLCARALATPSVTDDSRSATSISSSLSTSPLHTPTLPLASAGSMSMPLAITKDSKFVAGVLKERDEMERGRVAKAMLYQAFMQALRGD